MKTHVCDVRLDKTLRRIERFEVRRIASSTPAELPRCDNAEHARTFVRAELSGFDRERIIVLYLSGRNHVVGVETVAIGAESACAVTMTSIFRGAILSGARAIIVAHNHPSGDVGPSPEDLALLRKLKEAGSILDCPLVDFLIVAEGDSYSDLHSIEVGRNHA